MITRTCAAIALVAAGCGCGGIGGRVNYLRTSASPPETIAPPHEPIYMRRGDGLVRVYLDTGATEPWAAELAIAGDVQLAVQDDHVIVRAGGASHVVDGVVAGTEHPVLSPDRSRFALVQPSAGGLANLIGVDVAVVTLDGLAVRRYETGLDYVLDLRWAEDGAGLWIDAGARWLRIDLATAAVEGRIEPPPPPEPVAPAPPAGETVEPCADRGLRLDYNSDEDRHVQELRLLDTRSGAPPRVLAAADDFYSHPHMGTWPPRQLGDAFFTRSCTHFVFVFDTDVYVGDVATGRFAYLATGHSIYRDPPPP